MGKTTDNAGAGKIGHSNIIRRVSFMVADVEATAGFYQQVFGWTRFYDAETPVDRHFPPCAPDQTPAHIIILQADDPNIGMVGFMEYVGVKPETRVDKDRDSLGLGDSILIIEARDIQATYEKARSAGARLVCEPREWTVTAGSGDGLIHISTFSFFDPNGLYVEVNMRLS